ncbi:MAG: HRDC domain-containing protein, partial [Propionibacteriales bacterium]|nr:HRDC domain-containing protein [Propionibacteriales bacterium]
VGTDVVGSAQATAQQSASARMRGLLSGLGWSAEAPTGAGAVRERWESLAALLTVADDLVAADASVDLAAISAELDRRAEAQQVPSAQGVTLGTLHSAKGLEWDAVALVGVHEGTLPFVLAQSPAEVAEERRLLYVGITRAREHLQISWSRSRNGGNKRNPSRFLDTLRPAESVSIRGGGATASRTRQQRRTAQAQTCRRGGLHLESAAERKLGRHTGCDPTYDEGLLDLLKEWRRQEAAEQKLPAYCIFTDATLTALAEAEPVDERGLLKIHGLGRVKVDKYGEHVLTIVDNARSERSSEKDG